MSNEVDDGIDGVEGSDRRRARLSDLARLEGALARAEGRLAQVEALLEKRERETLPRGMFLGLSFIAFAINGTRSSKNFRQWAEDAWREYQAALAGAPVKSVEERYGSPNSPAPAATIPVEVYVPPAAHL